MKKLIALLLALVMILSLAACSKQTDPKATDPSATGATNPPKDLTKLDKIYWRDSYTVSDVDAQAARTTPVATVGSTQLTNGALQIYYWMDVYSFLNNYGNYLPMYGLDYTKPLDSQVCGQTDGTWQHYFLQSALETWHNYQALALMAAETNTPMDPELQETLDNLYDDLKKAAEEKNFASIDAMIQDDTGPGSTAEDYYTYTEAYYLGYSYFTKMVDAIEVTDAMIETYFNENKATLEKNGIAKDSGDVCSVRHVLVKVADKKTDADWETCRAAAQKLLDQWLAGEHTEDSFADMAKEHSEDGGSSSNGGLYTGLNDKTNFVKEFKDWYLAEGRTAGDYGLIKTSYGYHIMYFSGTEAQWISHCREAVTSELTSKIISDAVEKYKLTVDYDKIVLGEAKLTKN